MHYFLSCRFKKEGKKITGMSWICPKWKLSLVSIASFITIVLIITYYSLFRYTFTAPVVSTIYRASLFWPQFQYIFTQHWYETTPISCTRLCPKDTCLCECGAQQSPTASRLNVVIGREGVSDTGTQFTVKHKTKIKGILGFIYLYLVQKECEETLSGKSGRYLEKQCGVGVRVLSPPQ